MNLGDKHNVGLERAQGDVLAYWDDDDWFAPRRFVRELAPIVLGEASIVGCLRDYVLEIPACRWSQFNKTTLPVKKWVGNGRATFRLQIHDGTAMFSRDVLRHGVKHPPLAIGQKVEFLNGIVARGERWRAIPNDGLFVYVRHGSNTWQFREDLRLVERRRPLWFPEALLEFYRRCGKGVA
jgi:glycosyltransferase involved in cell wall biosynthesis